MFYKYFLIHIIANKRPWPQGGAPLPFLNKGVL